jgi:putative ABC transport system ATP-binding protein
VNAALPLLELDAVSVQYGTGAKAVTALAGVDLRVARGEMVAVMGTSGSGKSTLLACAGTLLPPTSGEVVIDGSFVSDRPAKDLAALRRRLVGFVFQDFNLIPSLTAVENVALPLELDGASPRAARSTALEALDRLGLTERADRFPDELSGGERQRVAIARAIVGERHLLLADEPSGALDSVNGESVMRLIRASCQGGVAGVVVTHDAQLASWADRVVFLRDGRIADQTSRPDGPESLLEADPAR